MKKILSLICGIILASAANAQIVSSSSSTIKTIQTEKRVYNRLSWGYAPQFAYGSDLKGFDQSAKTMHGFNFDWTIGTKLGKTDLYLETGLGMQFNNWNYEATYYETYYSYGHYNSYTYSYKFNQLYLAFKVPVQVAYRLKLSDAIAFQPYAGLYFKFNAVGIDTKNDDKYIVGTDEGYVTPVQVGFQFGVGFTFKKFYLGTGFAADFNRFISKSKISTGTFDVRLGVQF